MYVDMACITTNRTGSYVTHVMGNPAWFTDNDWEDHPSSIGIHYDSASGNIWLTYVAQYGYPYSKQPLVFKELVLS